MEKTAVTGLSKRSSTGGGQGSTCLQTWVVPPPALLCPRSSRSSGLRSGLPWEGGSTILTVSDLKDLWGSSLGGFPPVCQVGSGTCVLLRGQAERCPAPMGKGDGTCLAHVIQKHHFSGPTFTSPRSSPVTWVLVLLPPSRLWGLWRPQEGSYHSGCALCSSCAPGRVRSVRWVWAPPDFTFVFSRWPGSLLSGLDSCMKSWLV